MKPGIYDGLPMAEYLDFAAFSSGLAHTILTDSPLHAWYDSHLNPDRVRRDSSEMDIGTYAHAMLLEGGHDGLVVIEANDWRTKAAQEQRDAARLEGKLPILAKKLPEVERMVEAARKYIAGSEIAGVFDTGEPEQTVVWDEEGVLCKARPDWLTADRRLILSYKTTAGSANPDIWIRTQLPSYDVATVFYERGILAVCAGIEETRLVHLVQEQKAPFACSLIGLAPAFQDLAERKLERALALWKQCVTSGRWPAYPRQICFAEPRPWEISDEEERMISSAFSAKDLEGGIPL